MKIIRRLYLKDFLVMLFILAIGLSIIFSLIDLTGKIDDFMRSKYSIGGLILFSLYNMPRFFLYLLPTAVLISSLFTFSQASRRKELIAIKAAGGRLRDLFYPFVITGVLLSVVAFITSEVIVPDFSKRAIDLRNSVQGKSKNVAFSEGGLWLKNKDGSPVKIDLYIADKKIANGVSIFVIGDDFLKERILAEKAFWNGSGWILENITRYDIKTGAIETLKRMNYADLESPDLFTREIKGTDEMSIIELYMYMQRLKNAGFRNTKLAVDINSKISFPLINIFMIMLGLSLSSMRRLEGGLFSASLGLLISLFYWFSYTFSLSMGYSGVIPPLVSAWLIPVLFSALSVYFFVTIPE